MFQPPSNRHSYRLGHLQAPGLAILQDCLSMCPFQHLHSSLFLQSLTLFLRILTLKQDNGRIGTSTARTGATAFDKQSASYGLKKRLRGT